MMTLMITTMQFYSFLSFISLKILLLAGLGLDPTAIWIQESFNGFFFVCFCFEQLCNVLTFNFGNIQEYNLYQMMKLWWDTIKFRMLPLRTCYCFSELLHILTQLQILDLCSESKLISKAQWLWAGGCFYRMINMLGECTAYAGVCNHSLLLFVVRLEKAP